MKLSMMLNYAGGFHAAVDKVVEYEKAGLDAVWIAEAYSADAISQVGYLAAKTNKVEIGTGILNVFSRTPALMAMTAAGCDYVSNGRFILGLGASGPQVVEGFHGMPYEKPMLRIKEYIQACRHIWAREEPFHIEGQTVQAPLPAGLGTGLGKALKIIKPGAEIRKDIPIWWASLMGLSVTATAEPGVCAERSAKNTCDGLVISSSPLLVISKMPTSSVEPKRFLTPRSTRY